MRLPLSVRVVPVLLLSVCLAAHAQRGPEPRDLVGREWAEDDGTRLRKLEAGGIVRMQLCRLEWPQGVGHRLRPGLTRKQYTTRPLTHEEDTEEMKVLLALVKRAPAAKPVGGRGELAIRNRSLVVEPAEGEPFEILYASGFDQHEPFGGFHSLELKEALYALAGESTRIIIIHFEGGEVRRVIHHSAIAPHTGGVSSQTATAEMHLTSEKGLTLYVKVRDGQTVLMEDEKPLHYGGAAVFASKGPGSWIVLLHRP